MLDFGRLSQPGANLAPGSVIRDLMVDMPSIEIAKVYDELRVAAGFQDINSGSGSELDRKARNYGYSRLSGTPSTGIAVFTTNVLDSNIQIPVNTIITARNGQSFRITIDTVVDASKPNIYRSVATRLSADLQTAGIFDQFAVEVPVTANSVGPSGNISKFQLATSNIPGLSTVTNTSSFRGGAGVETDTAFRSRIISVFQGAAIGTETAYLSAVRNDSRIVSASLIGPGDLLMTRDGTVIQIDEEGTRTVISSGSGGKIDIVIQGQDIRQNIESYIYTDRSGRLDATDITNRFMLGQREGTELMDFPQRRREAALTGLYPLQPVKQVVSMAGSLSGPNFIPAYIDDFGVERGNFKLLKDDGAYAGSAFGFDSIEFISNQIAFEDEQISKPHANSSDPLDFTEVLEIRTADQIIPISREVVSVDPSDRQFVTLRHTPFLSVDRITNITTGERYRIVSQNPDGVTGEQNMTGRVQITGATLPRSNDVVEANYGWAHTFDPFMDFDNLSYSNRIRTAVDSVDWGYGSRIELEESETLYSVGDGYHVLTQFPISRIVNVFTYTSESVARVDGKLVLANPITAVLSVRDSDNRECFWTTAGDGSVSGSTITLPSDTLLTESATATVTYNQLDVYSPAGVDSGTFSSNKITLSAEYTPSTPVLVDYVAAYSEVIPTTQLSAYPAVGTENEWAVSSNLVGEQPSTFVWVSGSRTAPYKIAPSHLRFVLANIPSSGRLLINGKIWKKLDSVFTYTGNGFDLAQQISEALGSLPSGTRLAHVADVRKVELYNGSVARTLEVLDLFNYELASSIWSRGAVEDISLAATEFAFSSTTANADAAPVTGDVLSISYYVVYDGSERITISAAGESISANRYAYIDEIRVDAGFRNISNEIAGTIAVFPLNQPQTNTQYTTDYDYVSPKQGERLTITYDYNGLLTDLISVVEPVRPIGADILVKEKQTVSVYIDVDVVAMATFTGSTSVLKSTIEQNVINFVNGQSSGNDLDASDIVNSIYGVAGVDRVTITQFNTTGGTGVVQTISSDNLHYFVTESLTVTLASK